MSKKKLTEKQKKEAERKRKEAEALKAMEQKAQSRAFLKDAWKGQ